MAEKFCSEFGSGPHHLKIGKSFEKKGNNSVYHSIRYDFTPLSVDEDKMGKLEVQDNNAVSVSLPHNNGIDATNYKGQAKPSGTKDCILIIDHETGELTLERLSNQILLKKTRAEKPERQHHDTSGQYQVKAEPDKPVSNPYTVKREPDKPKMSSKSNTPASKHKQSPTTESQDSPARIAHSKGLSESSDSNSSSSSDSDSESNASSNEQSCQLAAAMEEVTNPSSSFSMPGDVSDLFLPGGGMGQLPTARPQKHKKSDKAKPKVPNSREAEAEVPQQSSQGDGSMPNIFALDDDLQLTDESDE